MTISFLAVPEERLLLVRIAGHISRAQNARALRRMIEEDVFDGTEALLIDVTGFTSSELETADMRWLVSEVVRQVPLDGDRLKVSICAAPGSFGYGMARVFHSYASISDRLNMVALHDWAEALRWLDLDADEAAYARLMHIEATVVQA